MHQTFISLNDQLGFEMPKIRTDFKVIVKVNDKYNRPLTLRIKQTTVDSDEICLHGVMTAEVSISSDKGHIVMGFNTIIHHQQIIICSDV